eukprot:6181261-Pleurochrysis_carterae.AAC.2
MYDVETLQDGHLSCHESIQDTWTDVLALSAAITHIARAELPSDPRNAPMSIEVQCIAGQRLCGGPAVDLTAARRGPTARAAAPGSSHAHHSSGEYSRAETPCGQSPSRTAPVVVNATMRVEVQPPSATTAEELRLATIGGDLLFDDTDELGVWQALLPSLHWRTDGYATLSGGDTVALALMWATLTPEARELTFGDHVVSLTALSCVLAVARLACSAAGAPSGMQWSQFVATAARLRPQFSAAHA